jgi:hypothetical protein
MSKSLTHLFAEGLLHLWEDLTHVAGDWSTRTLGVETCATSRAGTCATGTWTWRTWAWNNQSNQCKLVSTPIKSRCQIVFLFPMHNLRYSKFVSNCFPLPKTLFLQLKISVKSFPQISSIWVNTFCDKSKCICIYNKYWTYSTFCDMSKSAFI